jgi:hypothetical protein
MSFRQMFDRRNAYRDRPVRPATTVDRVADGYLRAAAGNGHLRRLLHGHFDDYRQSMTTFLATSCDESTEVRAAALLREAHLDLPITASDYELVGYYLLSAAGRYHLPVVSQATIAGALSRARPSVLGDSIRGDSVRGDSIRGEEVPTGPGRKSRPRGVVAH